MTQPIVDHPVVDYPFGPFTPWAQNPVLRPGRHHWESANVYNPAAIVVDGRVALLYRAHADDIVSSLGLAWSDDGYSFETEPDPVLVPEHDWERYGCEDPRVVLIDGTYYCTYTGWDRHTARLCLATSTDLRTWEKHGPMVPGINTFAGVRETPGPDWSKGGVILPEPVDGRWLMWFGEGNVHLATSTDLLHWDASPEPVLRPEPGTFMGDLVETGPQPVLTRTGHALLMHNSAVELDGGGVRYACGQVLIDPHRPGTVVAKLVEPWLEPSTAEELSGLVDNVTFVEGLVHHRGTWFAYYGQSDTTIGVATFTPGPETTRKEHS
ncbi:MAG: glycoside hydrolase family 130 protein [Pseudonocardia sp.]